MWKEKTVFFFFFFLFVDLYFMDLMNNQIITENNQPRCDKTVPHGDLESQLQSICQSCVREVCLWFIAVLSQTRVKLGMCLTDSPADVNLYAVCMNLGSLLSTCKGKTTYCTRDQHAGVRNIGFFFCDRISSFERQLFDTNGKQRLYLFFFYIICL